MTPVEWLEHDYGWLDNLYDIYDSTPDHEGLRRFVVDGMRFTNHQGPMFEIKRDGWEDGSVVMYAGSFEERTHVFTHEGSWEAHPSPNVEWWNEADAEGAVLSVRGGLDKIVFGMGGRQRFGGL